MTYTFKLARRLAVSRTFGMLPAIALFVACSGDATAPESSTSPQDDWRPRQAVPVDVSVNPSKVTVETNQLIRFRASARNSNGDSVLAPIAWRATGGTIQSDGRFSSAAVGTFMVMGRTGLVAGRTRMVMDRSDRTQERVDTSMVRVVRRQPRLRSIAVTPGTATLAPGASQTFLVTGLLKDGRTVPVGVTWNAGGGTIDAGGNFVAGDTAGTYKVIATHATTPIADTAAVTINAPPPAAAPPAEEPPAPPAEEPPPPPAEEPPPPPAEEPPAPVLAKVTLLPASATLAPSTTRQFTAKGTTATGDSIAVSVVFAATGGTIDAGGNYVAGDIAGTYRVTATNATSTLADTAIVTITAPPPPPPAPTPTLAQVTLLPASATLAPSTTRQFNAYGRTTAGDSVAVSVVFVATGGTVTAGGLYTAASAAGTYRIIASAGALADTSVITVTQPLGSGSASGIPFGPFSLWTSATATQTVGLGVFTASEDYTDASLILNRINEARTKKLKLMLAMTGGAHSNYLTNGRFDLVKWKARMDTYNTSTIKSAVAAGVADGTIIGNSVMDEPEHVSWGGAMTKPLIDQMGAYVKAIFPTLPVGVDHGPNSYYRDWYPTVRYNVLDYVYNQYNWWITSGDVPAWRDKVLAQARLDGVAVAFGLNILDGGIHDAVTQACPIPLTGGYGTYSYACRMTAAQVRDWGLALGPSGCALLMWRYDATFASKPDNMQAFNDVATRLATLPAKSCRRT